ncbi:DUF5710 domain-containing protein [Luteimonas sp. MC1750]|uniref:DUF5710 domain-containing protein n=1 Tax=Luteimonas sp. MC1750 TaxID=2799326 RepID=UPI0018F0DD30|nr:DUF5710 domain-containing protein [Luteimonas sp. MC1750]MBJ6984044.1 hypothetical protein [Luteimonas sp. MC1750]QQO06856.1 hypothetical protein JGR68_05360 [Luteimonas sp. MC1750]
MPTYFRIPHADRAQAKALGARWAKDVELWFAPDALPEVAQALAKHWPAIEPIVPVYVFPGEHTTFGNDPPLALELIPSTCWLTNLRSCLSPEDFKRVRMGIRQRSGKTCEVCKGHEHPDDEIYLDVHPRFEYIEGVQVLRRLVCVCTRCLRAIEFGTAQLHGYRQDAFAHLQQVNGWSAEQAMAHVHAAFEQWAGRSRMEWDVDLSIIEAAGIQVLLPTPEQQKKAWIHLDDIRPADMDISAFMATLALNPRKA